jgi:hypothetical protein
MGDEEIQQLMIGGLLGATTMRTRARKRFLFSVKQLETTKTKPEKSPGDEATPAASPLVAVMPILKVAGGILLFFAIGLRVSAGRWTRIAARVVEASQTRKERADERLASARQRRDRNGIDVGGRLGANRGTHRSGFLDDYATRCGL